MPERLGLGQILDPQLSKFPNMVHQSCVCMFEQDGGDTKMWQIEVCDEEGDMKSVKRVCIVWGWCVECGECVVKRDVGRVCD